MRNCTRDEGRSFEVGSQALTSSHRMLLSSVRWPIACAMQHGLLLWVNSLHYRTAALLSASPQLAESIPQPSASESCQLRSLADRLITSSARTRSVGGGTVRADVTERLPAV